MADNALARIPVASLANVPIIHVCYIFTPDYKLAADPRGKVQGFHSTIGVLVSKKRYFHQGCLEFAVFFFSVFLHLFFESILHSTSDSWPCTVEHLAGAKPAEKSNQVKPSCWTNGQMMILHNFVVPNIWSRVPHLFRSKSLSREMWVWYQLDLPITCAWCFHLVSPKKIECSVFWHQKKNTANELPFRTQKRN